MVKIMRVSIIIYYENVIENLVRCINSINGNNFKDYEIILTNINGEVINIINSYPFLSINVVNENSSSLSGYKNLALDKALGEYLVFMSSNDYLEMDFLNKMYNKAKMDNLDIVACDYKLFNKNINKEIKLIKYDTISDVNKAPSLYVGFNIEITNKMFKRELFLNNKMRFLENIEPDDYYLTLLLMKNSKTIGKVNLALYNKYKNINKNNKLEDVFKICDMVLQEYENSNNLTKVAIFNILVIKLFDSFDNITLVKDSGVRSMFIDKVYEYLDNNIISWNKMEYFNGIKGYIKKNKNYYKFYLNIKSLLS